MGRWCRNEWKGNWGIARLLLTLLFAKRDARTQAAAFAYRCCVCRAYLGRAQSNAFDTPVPLLCGARSRAHTCMPSQRRRHRGEHGRRGPKIGARRGIPLGVGRAHMWGTGDYRCRMRRVQPGSSAARGLRFDRDSLIEAGLRAFFCDAYGTAHIDPCRHGAGGAAARTPAADAMRHGAGGWGHSSDEGPRPALRA